MPIHSEEQLLPYSTQHIYNLVADVEHYPEFLPWCRAARILERGEREFLGELVICYKHICEQYTSRVQLTPPDAVHAPCRIDVTLVRGPFRHLSNSWEFLPEGAATRVKFQLDFAFKSKLLDKMLGGFFHSAAEKMVDAFRKRAEK
jgi:coenzyme Q-binding protein COQ10